MASAGKTPADKTPARAKSDVLIGSDSLGANLTVGDETIPLGALVAVTHKMSGLSVEGWNDLEPADRDKRLQGVLDAQNAGWAAARGSSASYVVDPNDPNFVTIRVKQAAAIPHPGPKEGEEETHKPVPAHILKVGANRVPRWVADHEMMPDILED